MLRACIANKKIQYSLRWIVRNILPGPRLVHTAGAQLYYLLHLSVLKQINGKRTVKKLEQMGSAENPCQRGSMQQMVVDWTCLQNAMSIRSWGMREDARNQSKCITRKRNLLTLLSNKSTKSPYAWDAKSCQRWVGDREEFSTTVFEPKTF